jgi:hypothetical protein
MVVSSLDAKVIRTVVVVPGITSMRGPRQVLEVGPHMRTMRAKSMDMNRMTVAPFFCLSESRNSNIEDREATLLSRLSISKRKVLGFQSLLFAGKYTKSLPVRRVVHLADHHDSS